MTPAEVRALAREHLTTRQYEAFLLVHELGLSQRAGAYVMGIDRSGFRHHLNRAYERLAILPEMREYARGFGPGPSSLQVQAGDPKP